jgi:TetR/AcrR family transcriptional repressor of nem operon
VPALGAEIARESPKTRKAFAAKMESMVDVFADHIPDVPRKIARKRAAAMIATLMGTVVMARIAGSGEFSDEILSSGREAALACASGSRETPKRAAKPATRKPAAGKVAAAARR